MIGAGVFIASGYALQEFQSMFWVLISWGLCAIISICGGLTWAEWALMFSKEGGGDVPYLNASIPNPKKFFAFVYMFLRVFVSNPMFTAVLSGVSTTFLFMGLGLEDTMKRIEDSQKNILGAFWYDHMLYLGFCFFFQVFAFLLLAFSAKILNACSSGLTSVKMGILVLLSIIGIASLCTGNTGSFGEEGVDFEFTFGGYSRALLIILFCYDGFANLSAVISILENPTKNTLKAIVTGCVSVAFLYIVLNVIFFSGLTLEEFKGAKLNQAAVFVSKCFENMGLEFWGWKNITNFLVLISSFGALWGTSFTGSELAAQATDNVDFFPFASFIRKKHPVFGTKFNAIVIHMVVSAIYTSLMTIPMLFDFYFQVGILANWLFYVITASSLVYLRFKNPNSERVFKVFLGCPLVVIITGIFIFVAKLMDTNGRYEVLFSFVAVLVSSLVYYFRIK